MSHWTRSSAYRLSNERSASSTVDPIPMIPSVTLDPRNAIHNWLRNDNCGRRVAVGLLGCAAQYFIVSSLACSGALTSARISVFIVISGLKPMREITAGPSSPLGKPSSPHTSRVRRIAEKTAEVKHKCYQLNKRCEDFTCVRVDHVASFIANAHHRVM